MAVDYFLKIDDIPGESKADKHEGEIDVLSWSWGLSNVGTSATGGGSGAGLVQMNDLSLLKKTDKATPKLLEACASGKHIAEATLTCRKAGEEQQEFFKIKLKDLLISSVQSSGSGDADIPESVSLNYSKVELEYAEQDDKGKLKGPVFFKWDVKARKKY